MKILGLTTFTADTEKNWRSLRCLGHDVAVHVYDALTHDRHGTLADIAREMKPAAIVYVGAIEKYHGRPVMQPDVLCRMREVAPTIHICGDGSDEPWWEHLVEYDRRGCFSAQISIDGNPQTPISEMATGLVTLTPTDPAIFGPRPWSEKNIACGMAGGRGHGERANLLQALAGAKMLVWMDSAGGASYDALGEFLGRCQVVANCPVNGSGRGDHVKGRVIEAAFAGAALLERANPITRRWFRLDEYFEYADPDGAIAKLRWCAEHLADVAATAERFRTRALAEHHPRVFWSNAFKLAGVTNDADGV